MSASLRKGWCPGALRPMAAKDGLLVRLRITGGILSATKAHALADLAARHGNGLFDLSARGNLQMRGVGEASLDALHDGLRALGLLDRDAGAESVRNVIASPLAGLDDGIDVRPLVSALEQRLTQDTSLHALPGKFGFLIDDGGFPSLADVDADIRFDWRATDAVFSIGLAGTCASAVRIGFCQEANLVERAAAIGRAAVSALALCLEGRRMRDAVAVLGADVIAQTCDGRVSPPMSAPPGPRARDIVGVLPVPDTRESKITRHEVGAPLRAASLLGLAAPFGRLDAKMLHAAATRAATTPLAELRLTPWRVILIPGAVSDEGSAGFIIDPADARLSVVACVGVDGCMRGTTSTHEDATRLAVAARGAGLVLHVSGCEKGCAKPSVSALTFVGRDGRYDIVRDGRASDIPFRRGLDLDAALDTLLEPA